MPKYGALGSVRGDRLNPLTYLWMRGEVGRLLDKNMDYSFEQTVHHNNGAKDKFRYQFLNIMAFLFAIGAFFGFVQLLGGKMVVGVLQIVLCVPAAIFTFIYKDHMVIEFDYSFYDDELKFDKILNLKRRKAMLALKVERISTIAPVSDPRFAEVQSKNGIKTYNFTLNEDADIYFIYAEVSSEKLLILFEPKMEFLKVLRQVRPSMVKL